MIPNRVVIDTNVLLDLLVFHDPRWHALLQALESGEVQAYTRVDCAREWEIVLTYSHLPLDDSSRRHAQQAFARLLRVWEEPPLDTPLPICKDKDDQKFLELARDCSASSLVTKDRALLKLARWTRKRAMFEIVGPQQYCLSLGNGNTCPAPE